MNALCNWLSMDRDDVIVIGGGFAALVLAGFLAGFIVRGLL